MSIGEFSLRLRAWPRAAVRIAIKASTAALVMVAFLLPANAQFWGDSLGWTAAAAAPTAIQSIWWVLG